METEPEKEKYPITYWVNKSRSIAVVRMSDLRIQGWKPWGRDLTQDFEHSHFQTTYPSKERLDEYLADFEPSDVDEWLTYQFGVHQLNDHAREQANKFKERRGLHPGVPVNRNPPPVPPKQ